MKTIITILVALVVSGSGILKAQECLWAKSASGSNFDVGNNVCTDINGNVIVIGYYKSPTITFGTTTLTNSDSSGNSIDIFIVKYASDGTVLWANSAGGMNDDFGGGVASDGSGNIYFTGYFNCPIITFDTINLINTSGYDFFIVKYEPNGTALWATSAAGNSVSVCTDTNANVFLTGSFNGTTMNIGTTTFTNTDNSGITHDFFIMKFNTNGTLLWANSVGSDSTEIGISISSDASGNAYVTGYFNSHSITFGTTTLLNAGREDVFIAKYAPDGTVLWAKSAGGTDFDWGSEVSTDINGSVYLTGYYMGPTFNFGTTTITNTGGYGGFIAKYGPDGTVLWVKSTGAGEGVCTDSNGNVFLTGQFQGHTITFGTTTLTNEDNTNYTSDIFIAKYDANGNVLWAKSAGGNNNDFGLSICNDANDNVYLTGHFASDSISFGTNTLTNTGVGDMFIAKYSGSSTCSAFYTLFPDSALQSAWYLVNQCMGSDSLSADSLDYVWSWGDSANSTSIGAYPSFTYNTAGNYTICVTITDSISGCSNTYCDSTYITKSMANQMISVNVISANSPIITGVSASSLSGRNEVGLSPNPTSSTITLTIPKLINTNISITNLTGRQVANYNLQNTTTKTIDVSHLAEGVYFVTLKSDEGVVTKKMVKRN